MKIQIHNYFVTTLKLNIFKSLNFFLIIYSLSFLFFFKFNFFFKYNKQYKKKYKKFWNNYYSLKIKLLFNLKNNFQFLKFFFKSLNFLLFLANIGIKKSLEIVGYTRRSWFLKNKKKIFFRLGLSFLKIKFITNEIYFKLFKKRFLFFFSNNLVSLYNLLNNIKKLKKTSAYKLEGIVSKKDKSVKLKKSKKQNQEVLIKFKKKNNIFRRKDEILFKKNLYLFEDFFLEKFFCFLIKWGLKIKIENIILKVFIFLKKKLKINYYTFIRSRYKNFRKTKFLKKIELKLFLQFAYVNKQIYSIQFKKFRKIRIK